MARIFVSYSRADRQFVDEIVPLLRRMYGHDSVWFDDDIHGGVDWWAMILHEVAACDLFIYLVSNDSLASPYCQAEFREALRLQKQFLPVIVRPKTAYPGDVAPDLEPELRHTQYVDLSRGFGDTHALTLLYASISRLLDAVPQQQPPPLNPQPVRQPPVPDRPVRRRFRLNKRWAIIIAAVVTGIFVIIAAFIGLRGNNDGGEDTAPTSTEQAIGMVDSPEPTATPKPLTPTPEPPTATFTPTLEIAYVVQTLDAQATADQMTQNARATAAARATEYAVGTQDSAAQTATAASWTDTPTPDMTASIDAYRTQQARDQTATATLWTFTPTPSYTPTLTPTVPTNTPTATPDPLQAALEKARSFSGDNNDWEPFERDFDGVTMVLVPAGCFDMGSENGGSDERPVHRVCFDEPFWIDKYEVTNAQFAEFLNAKGNQSEGGATWLAADDDDVRIHQRDGTWVPDDGYANHPAFQLTWYGASAYCGWRDARLPSEAEWEYAARGPDALVYPWGNSFVGDNVVYGENSGRQTAAVGSRPGGVSWIGALDMSGNVWEWVADWYDADYYGTLDDGVVSPIGPGSGDKRVLRGGSWHFFSNFLRGANRSGSYPDYTYYSYGFRCARSN